MSFSMRCWTKLRGILRKLTERILLPIYLEGSWLILLLGRNANTNLKELSLLWVFDWRSRIRKILRKLLTNLSRERFLKVIMPIFARNVITRWKLWKECAWKLCRRFSLSHWKDSNLIFRPWRSSSWTLIVNFLRFWMSFPTLVKVSIMTTREMGTITSTSWKGWSSTMVSHKQVTTHRISRLSRTSGITLTMRRFINLMGRNLERRLLAE